MDFVAECIDREFVAVKLSDTLIPLFIAFVNDKLSIDVVCKSGFTLKKIKRVFFFI